MNIKLTFYLRRAVILELRSDCKEIKYNFKDFLTFFKTQISFIQQKLPSIVSELDYRFYKCWPILSFILRYSFSLRSWKPKFFRDISYRYGIFCKIYYQPIANRFCCQKWKVYFLYLTLF